MPATNHPWEVIFQRQGRLFTEHLPGFVAATQKFDQHACRRILDLGCGNGRHVLALARQGFQPVGLDISSTGLALTRAWLQEECLPGALVNADARRALPFATESFDGLLSTQVIHHARLAEVRLTIAEIWRVLTRRGIAFVTVAGRLHPGEPYEEIEPGTFVPLSGPEQGLPHHIFSEQGLRSELQAFQIDEISYRAEGRVLAAWLTRPA
jgi:SAM-dependent methyltransferase